MRSSLALLLVTIKSKVENQHLKVADRRHTPMGIRSNYFVILLVTQLLKATNREIDLPKLIRTWIMRKTSHWHWRTEEIPQYSSTYWWRFIVHIQGVQDVYVLNLGRGLQLPRLARIMPCEQTYTWFPAGIRKGLNKVLLWRMCQATAFRIRMVLVIPGTGVVTCRWIWVFSSPIWTNSVT